MHTVEISDYQDYVTRSGDTYDLLAIAFYADEKKASYIVKANRRYMGTLVFEAGIQLRIPVLSIKEKPTTLPPWRQ